MAFTQNEKHKKRTHFHIFSSSSYCREASSFNMRIYKELLSRKIFFVKVVIKRGMKHKKFSQKFFFFHSQQRIWISRNKQAKKIIILISIVHKGKHFKRNFFELRRSIVIWLSNILWIFMFFCLILWVYLSSLI